MGLVFMMRLLISLTGLVAYIAITTYGVSVPDTVNTATIKTKLGNNQIPDNHKSILEEVPSPNAVDWGYIAWLFETIKNDTSILFEDIKVASEHVELSLKDRINTQVDMAVIVTSGIIQHADELIINQNLTRRHVIDLFDTQLFVIFDQLLKNLKEVLDQSSDPVTIIIPNSINIAKVDIKLKLGYFYINLPINWTDVSYSARDIYYGALISAAEQIKAIANDEEEQVGDIIGDKVAALIVDLGYFRDVFNASIIDHSLTENDANIHVDLLKIYFLGFYKSIKNEVARLSPSANAMIIETFNSNLVLIDGVKRQELLIFVRASRVGSDQKISIATQIQKIKSTLQVAFQQHSNNIDWPAIKNKVDEIYNFTLLSLNQAILIAENDSEEAGIGIKAIVDGWWEFVNFTYGWISDLISDQDLTGTIAEQFVNLCKALMVQLPELAEDNFSKLSASIRAEISDILHSGVFRVEELGQELHTFLSERYNIK